MFYAPDSGYTVARGRVLQESSDGAGADAGDSITMQGRGGVASLTEGAVVNVEGVWTTHAKYGRQLRVDSSSTAAPRTPEAVAQFLASGLFKGVGPAIAKRIVAKFGADTLEVMEQGRWNELVAVKGVSKRIVKSMEEAWTASQTVKDLVIFCQEHQLPPSLAHKLTDAYGAAALDVLQSDPYRMVIDVRGVGFRTADEIASKIAGASPTSPGRLQAAAVHALREAAQDGHCCLDADELLHRAVTALTTTRGRRQRRSGDVKASLESAVAAAVQEFLVGARRNDSSSWATPGGSSGDMLELPALVAMQVAGLVQRGVLKEEMSAGGGGFGRTMPLYFLPYLHWAEGVVAERVSGLLQAHTAPQAGKVPWEHALDEVLAEWHDEVHLSEEQIHAVKVAMHSPVSIITGGPGTGKTFTTRAIVDVWNKLGLRVKLACPTARAAHRLNGLLGPQAGTAVTLHRLLEFEPFQRRQASPAGQEGADEFVNGSPTEAVQRARFRRNKTNLLDADALLVDEASMLDVQLAAALLQAIRLPTDAPPDGIAPGAGGGEPLPPMRLVLVGDVDQLPSVGPGAVLSDLLGAGVVPSTHLTEVFRQAARSSIVMNAHQVNRGSLPRHFVDLPLLPLSAGDSWNGGGRTSTHGDEMEASTVRGARGRRAGSLTGTEMQLGMSAARSTRGRSAKPTNERPAPFNQQGGGTVGNTAVDDVTTRAVAAWRERLTGVVTAARESGAECLWVDAEAADEAVETIAREVVATVQAMGFDPRTQMQVLTPMHRGQLGTDAINRALQRQLNPPTSSTDRLATFRAGDRVMQVVNNYDSCVINGDIGYVVSSSASGLTVEFEDPALELALTAGRKRAPGGGWDSAPLLPYEREATSSNVVVTYTPTEARRQLQLAYAVTVHKAQGNEWPAVVVVAHVSHYIVLTRGLLYTALSRAQHLCVVLSTKKALAIAVNETRDRFRQTNLVPRLQEAAVASVADVADAAMDTAAEWRELQRSQQGGGTGEDVDGGSGDEPDPSDSVSISDAEAVGVGAASESQLAPGAQSRGTPAEDELDAQRRQQLWDSLGVASVVPARDAGSGGDDRDDGATPNAAVQALRGSGTSAWLGEAAATPASRPTGDDASSARGLWEAWGMEAALKRALGL